jgi:transcriptional regulator with XRE-family HTH domain
VPVDKAAKEAQPAVMRLGIALRAARLAAGLSQPELAAASEVSQSSLSRTEAGKHDPTVTEVARMESALQLTSGTLLVKGGFVSGLADVDHAIAVDPALSDREREWLTAAYRSALVASRPQKQVGRR